MTEPIVEAFGDYLRLQQKRIVQLEKMKKNVSKDEVAQIISKLQRAGILDENGNLAAPYNGEEQEGEE